MIFKNNLAKLLLEDHVHYRGVAKEEKSKIDTVNHPLHYNYGSVEVIDFIEYLLDFVPTYRQYHIGNLAKYLCRAPFKNGIEDIDKALWYANRASNCITVYDNVTIIEIEDKYRDFIDEVADTYHSLLAPSIKAILLDCFYPARLDNVIDELTYVVAQAKSIKTV